MLIYNLQKHKQKSLVQDQSNILFIVFENQWDQNDLAKEMMRHRLTYTQIKNPGSIIISVNIMSRVSAGNDMTITSDKPTLIAMNLEKGTFREHRGNLSSIEMDKFVRQVESGQLNVVRKPESHLIEYKWYTEMRTGDNVFNKISIIHKYTNWTSFDWGFYFLQSETAKIKEFFISDYKSDSIFLNDKKYNITLFDTETKMYEFSNQTGGMTIGESRDYLVIGFWRKDRSGNVQNYFQHVSELARYFEIHGF